VTARRRPSYRARSGHDRIAVQPVPGQPLFGDKDESKFPQAWRASREVLSLPCFPELTDAEVGLVVDAVKHAVAEVM